MLFNSHVFVLAFLPVTLAGWFVLGRLRSTRPARLWLLAASLVFYGWWSWGYLALLLATMVFNWGAGRLLQALRERGDARRARLVAGLAIAADLGLLGWFKYATFVAGNIAALTGLDFALEAVVLPLAISFHTFQQIAYLVDVLRGRAPRYALGDYLLFVSFFPQLIAGPIVHHHELLPQFARRETYRFQDGAVAAGVAFFTIGLVKKLVIADPVGALGAPVFLAAAAQPPGAVEAWLAVSAFAVGLYFDFSAYSDMAVGLARMFGIRLPYNFNSPYKATSIIEFWRRWHMTLSRFLRDYLYIPLGGSRYGTVRRYENLMITMLLGGLWHGAAWTFVLWGAYQGALLGLYRAAAGRLAIRKWLLGDFPLARVLGWFVMFHLTCYGWLIFRASSAAQIGSLTASLLTDFAPGSVNFAGLLVPLALYVSPLLLVHAGEAWFNDVLIVRRTPTGLRYSVYAATLYLIVLFGNFGGADFIYFQF